MKTLSQKIMDGIVGLRWLGATVVLAWGIMGCVETDGPARSTNTAMQGGNSSASCEAGSQNRKSVDLHTLASFYPCCDGSAHWLPKHLVPTEFHTMLESHPTDGRVCVPDVFATDPNFTPQRCTSVFGFSGVCISQCIPQVRDADVPLPKADCPAGQLCSPCWDPRSFEDTGACRLGSLACVPMPPNPGKDQVCRDFLPILDVSSFPTCCPQGKAHCAKPSLVAEGDRGRLAKCADGVSLCVPDDLLLRGGKYTPPVCRSVGNTEGRCLSVCLPEVASQLNLLPVSSCKPEERCVPCFDPRTEQDTGACTVGHCDKGPTELPPSKGGKCKDYDPTMDMSQMPTCCLQGKAHCAGPDLVSEKDRSRLDKCSDGVSYCVPDAILSRFGKYTPPTCQSVAGAEGRCLSICLPEVAQQISQLPTATCQPDERCVPCYDPRTGQGTGACTIGYCDKGPSQPPKLFQPCGPGGNTHAYCVPADLVPATERSNFDNQGCLAPSSCQEPGTICVPKAVMDAGVHYKPAVCKNNLWALAAAFKNLSKDPIAAFRALLSSKYKEGRCLSKCIARIRPMAGMLQKQTCAQDEVCAPCIDPTKLDQGEISTDRKSVV